MPPRIVDMTFSAYIVVNIKNKEKTKRFIDNHIAQLQNEAKESRPESAQCLCISIHIVV